MKKKTKLLIALLLVFVGVGLTYALYTTSVGGNANVETANWLIKVKTGSDFDNQVGIDVSNGATDINLGSCQKLAPGGSCTLPFRVDATGTEVDTVLTVELGSNVSGATLEELTNAGINLRISDGVNEDYAYLLNMGSYKDLNLVINWEAGDEDDDEKALADVSIANKLSSITIPVNMVVKQRTGGIRTVTFNTHDSNIETPESIQVNDGESILEANIPVLEKNGYIFVGWFTSEVGGVQLTSSTPIIDNIEYHARFREKISYTVTFNSDGGSSVSPVQVVEGSTLSSIPTSEKADYQFMGWYDSNDNKLTLETVINSNITYNANWRLGIPVVSESTLGINAYDGDLTTNEAMVRDTWLYLKLPENASTRKINVTFKAEDVKYANIALAFFDENEQLVSAKYQYTQSGKSDNSYTYSGALSTSLMTVVYNIPSGATYFGVQKTNTNANSSVYDIYLTPKQAYTIIFNSNGGSSVTSPVQVYEGNVIDPLPTSTKTGYEFMGWFDDENNKLTTLTVFNEDTIYTAKWRIPIPVDSDSTLGQNAYDGDLTTYDAMVRNTWKYLKLPNNIDEKNLEFVIRATNSTGTNITVAFFDENKQSISTNYFYSQSGDAPTASYTYKGALTTTQQAFKVMIPTGAVYVGFEKYNCNNAAYVYDVYMTDVLYYTVTFDSNGGSNVNSQTVKEGQTLSQIPTSTKTGYEFLGWFDSNNHMLTSSTKIERSKTYIAKWGVRISITEDSENTLSTNGYDGDMTTYDSMIRNGWKYVKLSSNSTDKKVNIVFKSALDSGTRFAMAFFDSSKQKIGTGYIYYTPDADAAGFAKIGDLTDETTMATLDIPSDAVYLGVEKVNCNNNVYVYDIYLTD